MPHHSPRDHVALFGLLAVFTFALALALATPPRAKLEAAEGDRFSVQGFAIDSSGNVRTDNYTLSEGELASESLTFYLPDVCAATAYYGVLPEAGTISAVASNVNGSVDSQTAITFYLAAVDATYTTEVTGATLTLAAGSGAGQVATHGAISGGNTFTARSGIKIAPDGACGGSNVAAHLTLTYTR